MIEPPYVYHFFLVVQLGFGSVRPGNEPTLPMKKKNCFGMLNLICNHKVQTSRPKELRVYVSFFYIYK